MPLYLFIAHPRTADDGVTKKMFWQPRLTKPEPKQIRIALELFPDRYHSGMLVITPRELWSKYRRSNVTEDSTVLWSINEFLYNKSS